VDFELAMRSLHLACADPSFIATACRQVLAIAAASSADRSPTDRPTAAKKASRSFRLSVADNTTVPRDEQDCIAFCQLWI